MIICINFEPIRFSIKKPKNFSLKIQIKICRHFKIFSRKLRKWKIKVKNLPFEGKTEIPMHNSFLIKHWKTFVKKLESNFLSFHTFYYLIKFFYQIRGSKIQKMTVKGFFITLWVQKMMVKGFFITFWRPFVSSM